MNPWLSRGNWSVGAQAGLHATQTNYIGKAYTKEAQDAMRENLRTSFESMQMRQRSQLVKKNG